VAAAPVSADVSSATVTPGDDDISAVGAYVIKFDAVFPLAIGDSVFVRFPAGTTLPASAVYANAAEVDVALDADSQATLVADTMTVDKNARTVEIKTKTAAVTVADHWTITFQAGATNKIYNPGTPGTYTLEVKTDEETTWVTSKTYTIEIPGKIDRYNKSGNYLGSSNTFAGLAALADYDKLIVGPGTYVENYNVAAGLDYVTIESSGTAADTVIKGEIDVNATTTYLTIDDLTIKPDTTSDIALDINGTNTTVTNCVFSRRTATAVETMIDVDGATTKIQDCTIDTTYGDVAADIGVDVAATTTITGCTFLVDQNASLVQDKAIDETTATTTTVSGCTFTGSSGIGWNSAVNSTKATIKTSTFDGLSQAIVCTGTPLVVIQNNTISDCSSTTQGAIDMANAAAGSTIEGNTIQNSAAYSIDVTAGTANIDVIGNQLLSNTKGLRSGAATLNAQFNWWGNDTGPTITTNVGGTGDICSTNVTYKPFAKAVTENARFDAGVLALDASTTVGIDFSTTAGAGDIALTKYASNPTTASPKYSALSGSWFDVYAPAATGTCTVKLYADGITSDTDAYVYSALEGKWVACSDQGASGTGDYVWVTIKATGTTPVTGDLDGTPFVLVGAPAAAALGTPTILAPEAGATNVPLKPVFQWTAVTDAKTYDLQVSDNYAFRGKERTDPPMIDRGILSETVYALDAELEYATNYYWRVRASTTTTKVQGEAGEWAVGVFSTMPAPAPIPETPEPTPPVILPAPVAATTPAYVWAIIGVGAILVIAVIVLIVRTRRAA
jgi:hypothetical protein